MIKTNLAVLMAQRGLKIADVHKATGISKTTLMALAENEGKGVQFDTVDKLCIFLGVPISEFLLHAPYMFAFRINKEGKRPNILVSIKTQEQDLFFEFEGFCEHSSQIDYDDNCYFLIKEKNIDYCFSFIVSDSQIFIDIINSLPIELKTDFYKELDKITREAVDLYKTEFKTNDGEHLKDEHSFLIYVDSFNPETFIYSVIETQ